MENVQGAVRSEAFSVQQLWILLYDIGKVCEVDMVWVRSHCGLHRNDVVDRLAKEALELPQPHTHKHMAVRVPIDYRDVKRRVNDQERSRNIIQIMPEDSGSIVTQREAETTLAQFAVGHSPQLHALGW